MAHTPPETALWVQPDCRAASACCSAVVAVDIGTGSESSSDLNGNEYRYDDGTRPIRTLTPLPSN